MADDVIRYWQRPPSQALERHCAFDVQFALVCPLQTPASFSTTHDAFDAHAATPPSGTHDVVHPVVLSHPYGVQSVPASTTGEHAPTPSQFRAGRKTAPSHIAATQTKLLE